MPLNCILKAEDSIVMNIVFFIRIVSNWNDLPRDTVEAESLHHFKNKLYHYLCNKF